MEDKKRKFLEEYKKLCLKYELYIAACGCCDSPWIIEGRNENLAEQYQLDDMLESFKHLENE